MRAGDRLTTLCGPPGVGKTRLAQRIAEMLVVEAFDSPVASVWWCGLAEASSGFDVALSVAGALDLPLGSLRDEEHASATVATAFAAAEGTTLLILDNVEHLTEAVGGLVVQWLDAAAELQILVTSREPLGLGDEAVMRLAPLPVPAQEAVTGRQVRQSEAAALLIDRARSVRPDFRPRGDDWGRVAELVRLLDGLPLALELAAARLSLLGVEGLLDRLQRRGIAILGGSHREGTHPALSLEDAIATSWELLNEDTRRLLAACAVFPGSFDIAAVERTLPGLSDPVFGLEALHAHSLVAIDPAPGSGDRRLRLLRSIRAFALSRLEEQGDALETTHVAFIRGFGDAALEKVDELIGAVPAAFAWVAEEHHNLAHAIGLVVDRPVASRTPALVAAAHAALAALDLGARDRVPGIRIAGLASSLPRLAADQHPRAAELDARRLLALQRVRVRSGNVAESDRLFGQLREHPGSIPVVAARARLLAGMSAWRGGAFERSEELMRSAADAYEQGGARARASFCLGMQAVAAHEHGRLGHARELYRRAIDDLTLCAPVSIELGRTHTNLGSLHFQQMELAEADECTRQAIRINEAMGGVSLRTRAGSLNGLAAIGIELGRRDDALALCGEARRCFRALGDRRMVAVTEVNEGNLHLDGGAPALALPLYRAAIQRCIEAGDPRYEAHARHRYGLALRARGDLADADDELGRAAGLLARAQDRRLNAIVHAAWCAVGSRLGAKDQDRRRERLSAAFEGVADPLSGHVRTAESLAEAGTDDVGGGDCPDDVSDAREAILASLLVAPRGKLSPWRGSFLVRVAVAEAVLHLPPRILERAAARAVGEGSLVVAADRTRNRLPDGSWCDLSTRLVLVALWTKLVETRLGGWTGPVDGDALRSAGWPDERMLPQSATDRLHKSISLLRRRVGSALIQRFETGYRLDPAVEVVALPDLTDPASLRSL